MTNHTQCVAFVGNPDFYGLGIRIGVYLQLGSSHITNSLNQEAAAENYAANSIFVFAIIVALLKAVSAKQSEIRPIEAWIMLQICISFFLTTLGLFGVRLHFLHVKRLREFVRKIKLPNWNRLRTAPERIVDYHYKAESGQIEFQPQTAPSDDRTHVLTHDPNHNPKDQKSIGRFRRATRWMRTLVFRYYVMNPDIMAMENASTTVTLDGVSFAKHQCLSWGGSAWRISSITIVACTNVWFWFSFVDHPQEDSCSPVIFFFAPLLLSSHPGLKTFFKVGSIFLLAPLGYLVVVLIFFAELGIEYLYEVFLRYNIRWSIHQTNPATWNDMADKIKRRLDKISPYLRPVMMANPALAFATDVVTRALKNEIWMNDENALPTWSDLAKAYAFMSSKENTAEIVRKKGKKAAGQKEKPSLFIWVCIAMFQLWSIGAIIWFIAAVELTIRWNHILNVHTISSTSQLIPLVIGIVSSTLAAQQIILKFIKRKYEDWDEIDFRITIGAFGQHSMQLIKRKKVPSSSGNATQTAEDTATVGQEGGTGTPQ